MGLMDQAKDLGFSDEFNQEMQTALNAELERAVRDGNLEKVKLAIEHKANPNTSVSHFGRVEQWYPTHPIVERAVENDNIEIITALLEAGADSNAYVYDTKIEGSERDGTDETVRVIKQYMLDIAARKGSEEAVQALLKHGATVRGALNSRAPMHWAAAGNHVGIIDILFKAGADINSNCPEGTPAEIAHKNKKIEALAALVRHGAKIKPDYNLLEGLTPAQARQIQRAQEEHRSATETAAPGVHPII